MATGGGFKDRQGGALCTSSNVSRRAGTHGLGAAHHPPLLWPAGRAQQTGRWCMCIVRSWIQCALVLSTQLRQRYKSWLFRGVRHRQTGWTFQPTGKKRILFSVCGCNRRGSFPFKNAATTLRPALRHARNDWQKLRRPGATRGRVDPPCPPTPPADEV